MNVSRGSHCRSLTAVTFVRRVRFSSSQATDPSGAYKHDERVRLSEVWLPTGGIASTANEDAHAKLVRAGFLRQAHSGIFHILPLGRRVQTKLEALIDKHMSRIGASKLDLSSISSEEMWARSGRLDAVGSELLRFTDRKDTRYLLSPTHEEEITALVSGVAKSYKDLPIRLYQISRKYRDELRPRHGLLRSREFTMKDLYTFDHSSSLALLTYHEVRQAYTRIFNELKLPYIVAEADSGSIGGNLSHEFHFPTATGEDHIISCSACSYVANEELAESRLPEQAGSDSATDSSVTDVDGNLRVWRGVTLDRSVLVNVWFKSSETPQHMSASGEFGINPRAVKEILPDFDASVDNPLRVWEVGEKSETLPFPERVVNLLDGRLSRHTITSIKSGESQVPIWPAALHKGDASFSLEYCDMHPRTNRPLNLLRIQTGDRCCRCEDGDLKVQRAIELGHTFHLGTRYSEPMMANVEVPWTAPTLDGIEDLQKKQKPSQQVPMEMGCHGIGVTRMIGAVADSLADEVGLNWPRVMAPYEIVVIPGRGLEDAALGVYDMLSLHPEDAAGTSFDLVLDDRSHSFPWKMRDADLIGYPVIVVVGKMWAAGKICEVQCRRLGVRSQIPLAELSSYVSGLLAQL